MRVSKILCATLLCGMVGTAFGVPTLEDRKKLCEQNPDKFVWVEKTQTCIPQNPCLSERGTQNEKDNVWQRIQPECVKGC